MAKTDAGKGAAQKLVCSAGEWHLKYASDKTVNGALQLFGCKVA